MTLSQALPSRITLVDALEFSRTLAKHNPFVRMKDGFDRNRRLTPEQQELANQAGTLLSRMANTEELEFLMKDEKMKVRNFVANAEKALF